MKKLLIGIALLFCCGLDGFCVGNTFDDSTETHIRIAVTGGRPRPRPRSVTDESIEIFMNKDYGMLTVLFNEDFGTVIISVKNSMGITVAATQCDTTQETAAYLNVPTAEDTYMLTIVGSEIEAVGYYDL